MPNKNIIALKQQILTALMGRIPTHTELLETAQSYRSALQILLPVSDDEFSQIVRDIEGQIPIRMGVGQILTDRRKNYSPWYGNRRATITPTFWERFRQYLFIEKGWSAGVIDPIDEISNTIVGHVSRKEKGNILFNYDSNNYSIELKAFRAALNLFREHGFISERTLQLNHAEYSSKQSQ
jgi:hypothetical protein